MRYNLENMVELDFILPGLPLRTHANEPIFNTAGNPHRQGRHPLIDSRQVVPIDIRIREELRPS